MLAASIEYGLDGLTKVNTIALSHILQNILSMVIYVLLVVCSVYERFNNSGYSV